jgi:hypothetical protein
LENGEVEGWGSQLEKDSPLFWENIFGRSGRDSSDLFPLRTLAVHVLIKLERLVNLWMQFEEVLR